MQGITIAPGERKDLILRMKRERKPNRRLRMHIVLLASEGYSVTEIARTLFCSHTTVYAVVGRFVREEQTAFDDRRQRGPAPLVEISAQQLVEDLAEGVVPTERGWLRSRWSCKLLALELFKERALVVSQETVGRVLHRSGISLEKASPRPTTQRSQREAKKAPRNPKDAATRVLLLPGRDQA